MSTSAVRSIRSPVRGSGQPTNPFSACFAQPGSLDWIDDGTGSIADHWQRFLALGGRAAIIGPHGSGKTTLLTHLSNHARSLGYHSRLVRGATSEMFSFLADHEAAESPHPALLAIDSAEQLSRFAFYRIKRRVRHLGIHLVVTAHAPLGLPVLHRRQPTEITTRAVLSHLLGAVELSGEDLSSLPIRDWLQQPETMRDVIRIMYDRWEEQVGERSPADRRQQQETSQ
ncbi:MAG: hypothetical protein AAGB34_10505 [Planctomycetota bacterium]